ncbi:YidC/Oxa1 family membrane protein insertase [Silvimonas terrae]|uniref:Membrane protein insertase YidC n=1 Tax=Silvimonas terrae TaxID=300266 RepID=A0A840RHH1_9NEIS|nr:membrane protein insertase YidC [Silvimonas terrae]MBB5191880.1 YidC/Oxa1 family membrane protein insertase [Silvimonas terrae]
MDIRRLILFIAISFGILFFWQKWMDKRYPQAQTTAQTATASGTAAAPGAAGAAPQDAAALAKGQRIKVTTDLFAAEIDTNGGDLRQLQLLKHGAQGDTTQPFTLLQDSGAHTYVAQTGLIGNGLPTHKSTFTSSQAAYALADGQNKVEVRLDATGPDGVKVTKIYTFTRGSYVINVGYDITNGSTKPLATSAYFRLLRDGKPADQSTGPSMFGGAHTFTGPAVYTEEGKFQKVDFSKIDKGEASYTQSAKDGWVAMIQHYFASAWIMSPLDQPSACGAAACRYELKKLPDGLYSAGAIIDLPAIPAGGKKDVTVELYAGPQETAIIDHIAPGFDLIKDYGIFTVFSKPIFWLLDHIHKVVGNWGWSIIILTMLIKALFYPLASKSYRSMAKMRKLAPRLEQLKERHGDDRMKFQQATMELYKTEKVNPLGGCLPMLVQIPIFISLYWALLAAVELRQAPWILWIHDLSVKDPYYVLPVLMTVSMYVQTLLSPPPPDPMQAKMMKIMPLIFSVFFFFFPAGLVIYWVVNNVLSITQQWYITHSINKADKTSAA